MMGVAFKKSMTSSFKKIKAPQSGGQVVIYVLSSNKSERGEIFNGISFSISSIYIPSMILMRWHEILP